VQRLHRRQLGSVAAHVAKLGAVTARTWGRGSASRRHARSTAPVDSKWRPICSVSPGHHRREPAQRLGQGDLVLGWDIGRVVPVEQVEAIGSTSSSARSPSLRRRTRAQPADIQRDGESHGESCQGKRGEEDREHQPQ
jgi:hypothetical protein